MKKLLIATLISVSSLAAAQESLKDFYFGPEVGASVSTKAGTSYYNQKLGTSASFGVFAGYKVCPHLAFELNLSNKNRFNYRNTIVDNVDRFSTSETQGFSVTSLTSNGLLYINSFEVDTVKPFVGAGVGVASVKSKTFSSTSASTATGLFAGLAASQASSTTHRNTNFTYNLGAGVEFPINNIDFRISYRFSDFGKAKTTTSTTQGEVLAGNISTLQTVTAIRKARLQAHELLLAIKFKI